MLESGPHILPIRTPEGVTFSMPLAGPATRFFAWAIDFGCLAVAYSLLSRLLSPIAMLVPDLGMGVFILAYFLLTTGYRIALEWLWRGQTVGKRLLRLRVVDARGLKLRFSQIVIRNLLRFVDGLPAFYLVGGVACFMSRRAQRLGDFAANTVVIRPRTAQAYDSESLGEVKYNSLREYPHIEARLRQRTPPEEAALALQALMRREELEPVARIELFRELADRLRAAATFPEEATFGLTDEQYVRNAVDSLFQERSGTA